MFLNFTETIIGAVIFPEQLPENSVLRKNMGVILNILLGGMQGMKKKNTLANVIVILIILIGLLRANWLHIGPGNYKTYFCCQYTSDTHHSSLEDLDLKCEVS